MLKAIYNAKIVTDGTILPGHAVVFSSRIEAVVPETELSSYQPAELIDAQGRYVAPGFIDIHIHGCDGADAMDSSGDALARMSRSLPRTGVTAFLPATMTMSFDRVEEALQRIRTAMGTSGGAEVLGCHMEGPFISENYRGAQDKRHILTPDFAKIEKFVDVIKIATIAPELPGSLEFIRRATARGIVVSIGHSAATYDEAMAAIQAGASHVTHTFNALAGMNHRQPGVIGALADHDDVTCELIADNVHVHPAAQRLLLKLKGPERMVLITDAMRAGLMPEGRYDLGGQPVTVKNGEARLANGALAGSVLTLSRAAANFRATSGLPLPKVIELVSANPARRIGVADRKGSITAGKDADLVLFDDCLTIYATFSHGRMVYRGYPDADYNC